MDREMNGYVVIVMMVFVSFMGKEVLAQTPSYSPPSPPAGGGQTWKHLLCSLKCAKACQATLRHFPIFCMAKCVFECMESHPSDAIFYCTLDCAHSSTSAAYPDQKQLERSEALRQIGDNVGYCYDNCNKDKIHH